MAGVPSARLILRILRLITAIPACMMMEAASRRHQRYNFYVQLTGTGDMLLGQHVYVEPDFGQTEVKDGIWIDESYVVKDGDDAYVWTLNKKDKLEKTKVELGDYDENLMMYEIKSGLTKDDYIVWASDDLYEGGA